MIGERLGARGFNKAHQNALWSPLGFRLTGIRRLLNTGGKVATVDDSEGKIFF